jgi:alanyl-tRNA synthetase
VKASEIRSRFLNYFAGHSHEIVRSSSLIPHNDPTLFFVNAGMVQFKDAFLGLDPRANPRATSVQKCLRVSGKHNDLENVGRTPRHHTFFEMLGNFSFGDYFKAEAIPFAWEFLTGELGLNPERLWVTVYEEDDEAADLWRSIGFPAERLQRLGAKDNFWSMGDTGPCGPCTEIHWDHGAHLDPKGGGPATGSDRYVEIWNLVFMQFDQSADGTRTPLPRPSIDTGAGLERVAAVKQGVYSNYDTDLFQGLIQHVARASGKAIGADPELDVAMRVIADHARATAFLVADGVMPSNEGRGYVLRRVMRRAIRFGVKLGFDAPFLHQVTHRVAEEFAQAYPDLSERRAFVGEVVLAEEERFSRTLDRGMRLLDKEIERAGQGGTLPGEVAFTLSDTFGFPLDLTELIAGEKGVSVDGPGYQAALGAQKARGRAAWKGSGEQAVSELWHRIAEEHGETTFTGYDRESDTAAVIALARRDASGSLETVERLEAGEKGVVVLERTPFYAESGGQVGDTGELAGEGGSFTVLDTQKASGLHLHEGEVGSGGVSVGDALRLEVASGRRDHTRRNHSATHLLHAALRTVLGEHVSQKGSLVGPNRLRFDFAHHKPMTDAELRRVEDMVNVEIRRNIPLRTRVESLEAARAAGAMALFGEKYDDVVRVVEVPGFSVELCGGTHVRATGDIGLMVITSEAGVAAGVRRIEAQTGEGAQAWYREQVASLQGLAQQLKTSPERVGETVSRLQEERKQVGRQLEALQREAAAAAAGDLASQAREVGGVRVLVAAYDGDLREQADRLRGQLGTSLVVLANAKPDKVLVLVAASKDIAGARVNAGQVLGQLAPLVGGRGGGRPDLAQGGGSDPAGLPALLDRAWSLAGELLA